MQSLISRRSFASPIGHFSTSEQQISTVALPKNNASLDQKAVSSQIFQEERIEAIKIHKCEDETVLIIYPKLSKEHLLVLIVVTLDQCSVIRCCNEIFRIGNYGTSDVMLIVRLSELMHQSGLRFASMHTTSTLKEVSLS